MKNNCFNSLHNNEAMYIQPASRVRDDDKIIIAMGIDNDNFLKSLSASGDLGA